jgi:hypothetical protein
MITLSIRYTLDPSKLADFAAYARALDAPIRQSGGNIVGYYLPTKFAGPTNIALALIDFPSLAAYETYREALAANPANVEALRSADASGCILVEDRSFMARVS